MRYHEITEARRRRKRKTKLQRGVYGWIGYPLGNDCAGGDADGDAGGVMEAVDPGMLVYHGTSKERWTTPYGRPSESYLTASREVAQRYADEWAEAGETPLVVAFKLSDLLALGHAQLEPNWEYVDQLSSIEKRPFDDVAAEMTWERSLKEVGTFCVQGFLDQDKALGVTGHALTESTNIVAQIERLTTEFAEKVGARVKFEPVSELRVYSHEPPALSSFWSELIVPRQSRGQGIGRRVVEFYCGLLDRHGVTSYLCPSEFDEETGLSTDQLERWYRGFGWDWEDPDDIEMVRRPA